MGNTFPVVHECKKCGACCKAPSNESHCVILYPSDVDQISHQLQIPKAAFLERFCVEANLLVKAHKITLYLLRFVDFHCIFLGQDNLCKIYEFRPAQCRKAPYGYFSYQGVWNHMPCLDADILNMCASRESDKILIKELLRGYSLENEFQ